MQCNRCFQSTFAAGKGGGLVWEMFFENTWKTEQIAGILAIYFYVKKYKKEDKIIR